jgi:sugar lactone lactonase YvrE
MANPNCIAPAGDWTGEGVVWHEGEKAAYWVDIERFLIHRLDSESRGVRTWVFTEPVTTLGLTSRPDTLIVATGSKLVLWQPANDARADFARPDKDWPRVRANDGRPDPAGNFWFGTMRYREEGDEPLGRLYRVAPDGSSTVEKTGIGISNTFCWSPDATRFYFGDTLANTISVWDYDVKTGTIANERPFFSGFDRGLPDGSAMDSDGFLWNARYDGGCIVRVAPDGKVDWVIDMPVAKITTCTFGGPQLKTLYITSAGGSSGGADQAPLAGSLFSLAVDVPGLPENKFRLGPA